MLSQLDVFTIDEIARAAGVEKAVVQQVVESGAVKPVAGTHFFDTRAAVAAGRQARQDAAAVAVVPASAQTQGASHRDEQGQ
jgi:hypothetical protein